MNNPYEYLYMSRMEDEWSQKALFQMYRPLCKTLVNVFISRYRPFVLYKDDLVQEAQIALAAAIEGYRSDRSCGFKTFLSLVIQRRLMSVMRHYQSKCLVQMHETFDIETQINDHEVIYDVIEQKDPMNNPEYHLYYEEALESLKKAIGSMSHKEKKVLQSWEKGDSYQKASLQAGCTLKSYDGRLQRVKKKVHEAFGTVR